MKSLLGVVLGVLVASSAAAGTIGLFSTPDASSCDLRVSPETGSGTFYVCASSSTPEETCGGICGAEFRITGLPSGWIVIATPSSDANTVLGDPFGSGVSIGYPRALDWGAAPVVLYTVVVIPIPPGASGTLQVGVHAQPTWELPCPKVAGACFDQWAHCVSGGALLINSPVSCTLGVQESTWGQLKAMFR